MTAAATAGGTARANEPLEVRFGKAAQLFEAKAPAAGAGEGGEDAPSAFASAAKMWGQR